MRKLVGLLWVLLQVCRTDSVLVIPGDAFLNPASVPLFISARHDEKFDLHLLELTHTEDEVFWRDFIPVGFADLSDSEWKFAVRRIQNILEIDEYSLGGFRPQISDIFVILDWADRGFEHQIERPRLGEVVNTAFRAFLVWFDLVGSKALFTFTTVDEWIRKGRFVARIAENQFIHEDGSIQAFDVVTLVNVCAPPGTLHIVLEFDAHTAVVPGTLQAAVKLAALKQEASPFTQRDDLVHRCTSHRSNIPCSSCDPSFVLSYLSFSLACAVSQSIGRRRRRKSCSTTVL